MRGKGFAVSLRKTAILVLILLKIKNYVKPIGKQIVKIILQIIVQKKQKWAKIIVLNTHVVYGKMMYINENQK